MPVEAWLLGFASAFCFALALVLTQFGLRWLPPGLGATVSIPSAALVLWAVAPFLIEGTGGHAGALAIFAAVGLLFPAAVTLLTFEANRRMGPNVTGTLGNLAPLFAVLFAVVALGETPNALQVTGIAAIVTGVTLLSTDRRSTAQSWPRWALALPLIAALVRGLVQPVIKIGLTMWPSPYAAVLAGYTVSSIVVIGAFVLRWRGRSGDLNLVGLAWFAAVGLCNSLAVLTMYAALALGPVTLVSPLVASYPLITLILGAVLFRPVRTSRWLVAGVAATVAGVAALLIG